MTWNFSAYPKAKDIKMKRFRKVCSRERDKGVAVQLALIPKKDKKGLSI